MKKILPLLILMLTILFVPATALAASGKVISGPSGPGANGWFSAMPTYTVDTIPGCPSGPRTFTVGSWGGEGTHHITFRSYDNNHPTIDQLDDHNGTGTNAATWICTASDGPAYSGDPVIFYEGDIKWDGTAPTISISSPATNTNIDSGSVQVSGNVSDATSGIWKVVINGTGATVSGGSFSASVPVNNGLNTLTATVYDYAGNTSKAQVVVNRVTSCGGTCSASSGSTSNTSGSSSSSSQAQNSSNTPATTQQVTDAKSSENATKAEENKDSTPTMVKGVVQNGGIGLATILAFVVILLLLDKFRIIEIKAFSNITNKINKNKSKTTTPKKKAN